MRNVHGSVDKLEKKTIQKMLEVKVVPNIRLKDQKQMQSNWDFSHSKAGSNAPGVEMTMNK